MPRPRGRGVLRIFKQKQGPEPLEQDSWRVAVINPKKCPGQTMQGLLGQGSNLVVLAQVFAMLFL